MIRQLDSVFSSRIAVVVLASGAFSTLVYRSVGLECPMRSVGLACPGCGCGRAATALMSDGLLSAFQQQPTASLLLMSLVVLAVLGRWQFVSLMKWRSNFVVLLPFHLAFANLVFQLIQARSTY